MMVDRRDMRRVALELRQLHESSDGGAAHTYQLNDLPHLRRLVQEALSGADLDLGNSVVLHRVLVAVDRYARQSNPKPSTKNPPKKPTETQIVEAVGYLIFLDEQPDSRIASRKRLAKKVLFSSGREFEGDEHADSRNKISEYREIYVGYLWRILSDSEKQIDVLKPVKEWLENLKRPVFTGEPAHNEVRSLLGKQQEKKLKQQRQSAVLKGAGLYSTLRNLYPSYELLELWGITMPICVFPANPSEWSNLESALGKHPANQLPLPFVYSDEFYQPGQKILGKMHERFNAPETDRTKFFPGPTYALDRIHLPQPGEPLKVDFKFGRFFTKEVTSEALDPEMMDALAAHPDAPVTLGEDTLPMRDWLHKHVDDIVVDGSHRDGGMSHATAIMLANEKGTYDLVLTRRTGEVATHPYFSHVCPSGMLSPYSEDPRPDKREFSVLRNFYREYTEEMFDKKEHALPSSDFEKEPDPADEPEVVRLNRLIQVGAASLTYTGLSVNLLTMRPEICLLLRIEDTGWWDRERDIAPPNRSLKLNWEYLKSSLDEVVISKNQPTHWRIELDEDLRPKSGIVFEPDWVVPNAAAAVKLAIDVMQAQAH